MTGQADPWMRPSRPATSAAPTTGVLCSAGLDSAVLLAATARDGPALPIYVAAGLAWEADEWQALERLVRSPVFGAAVFTPARLEFTARDLYPAGHWAVEGRPPSYDTDDAEVYLPGRNLMLLSKAAILCATRGIARLVIGPLAGNPFPDATPSFFEAMARAASLGLAHAIRIEAPFLERHKSEVIRLGVELGVPLEQTLSCMQPVEGLHCGRCSKCRERRDAFVEAGVTDRTVYRAPAPRSSVRTPSA